MAQKLAVIDSAVSCIIDSGNAKSKGKTEVYLHLANGEVVAGTSFPVMDEPLAGGAFSLAITPISSAFCQVITLTE
ncbi:hypothetical protein [Paenibacillus chitinolyticus]|uniref:Uncharacterized protein n=1 Tax=Paenibacillus chitinolyticus TaxID=79263 RepID=A0ABT4FF80_9BACL|nr:hypothetical protein [Paenibacillus chitinolyticus]MCY9591019.1 hypothetical protein [Paenibacillus chitinolyticus]MCY9597180.1 hypothetical protein [Paenibacillus chitinolyticus]